MASGKYIHLTGTSVEERRQQLVRQEKSLTAYLEDLQKTHTVSNVCYTSYIGPIGFVLAAIVFFCFIWYMNTGWRREVAEIKAYNENVHGRVVDVVYENGEIIITQED